MVGIPELLAHKVRTAAGFDDLAADEVLPLTEVGSVDLEPDVTVFIVRWAHNLWRSVVQQ